MTRRITAVELDDALDKIASALARLTPEERAALAADMPPEIMALADQTGAAQAQSVAWAELAGVGRVGWFPQNSIADWVRLGLLDAVAGWISGHGRTCVHMPSHRRPEPVFACAWRPGLIVCSRCLHLLDVTGAAARVCDCCGHLCAGDDDDPIYTGTTWLAAVSYEFGACGDCRPWVDSEGAA